jgi:hypothetical protein
MSHLLQILLHMAGKLFLQGMLKHMNSDHLNALSAERDT